MWLDGMFWEKNENSLRRLEEYRNQRSLYTDSEVQVQVNDAHVSVDASITSKSSKVTDDIPEAVSQILSQEELIAWASAGTRSRTSTSIRCYSGKL
jgi:hypothetical protein